MSVPFNHADGARKNRDGDDLPNDVRRQKSAAARVNPQRDASAENLAKAKTSNWSGRGEDPEARIRRGPGIPPGPVARSGSVDRGA